MKDLCERLIKACNGDPIIEVGPDYALVDVCMFCGNIFEFSTETLHYKGEHVDNCPWLEVQQIASS